MVTVEIIAIGNELLLGDVLDTNTHWLCRRLTGLGAHVRQATLVRDDPQAIGEALRHALDRGTQVIITTGGLGPTDDDLTLASIAAVLGRPLEVNPVAYAWVRDKYAQLAERGFVQEATMTEPRVKMARLPAGATPIHNPVGAAPAVLLSLDKATIICLPGVPAELKGIFEESLPPVWRQLLGEGFFLEKLLIVSCQDESLLAPLLHATAEHHPRVYIKSHAGHFGPHVKFRVTLSATGDSRQEVAEALARAEEELRAALAGQGLAVESGEGG